jgi:hypothetical protein
VLDPDAVVPMLAAVRTRQAEELVAVAEVHDLLGAPVGRVARVLLEAERAEKPQIEGDRPVDVADGEVDVMAPRAGTRLTPSGARRV